MMRTMLTEHLSINNNNEANLVFWQVCHFSSSKNAYLF